MEYIYNLSKDTRDLLELILRFLINFSILLLMVKFNYNNNNKSAASKFIPTFYLLNITVFFLCYLFSSVKLSVGFAFGLFAVFSILRYRTVQLAIKEMTFLFVILGLALINSLSSKKIGFGEIAFANIAIFTCSFYIMKRHAFKEIMETKYEYYIDSDLKRINLDLIREDISKTTGLNIIKIKIEKIYSKNNKIALKVYYRND